MFIHRKSSGLERNFHFGTMVLKPSFMLFFLASPSGAYVAFIFEVFVEKEGIRKEAP